MNDSPYSFDNFVKFINQNFAVLLLIVVGFSAGFFAGSVWTENRMLRSGTGAGLAAAPTAGDPTAAAPAGPEGPTEEQLGQLPAVTDADHVRGNPDAPIKLVEYSDFECPFCARFHPTMVSVLETYGDDVAWVYRHYPLSFHPQARPSAIASECIARDYGNEAFWSYADALFEETEAGAFNSETIYTVAEELGYDRASLETCVENEETAEIVDEQFNTGSAAGVAGTPGTFIVTEDGAQELIPGALPTESVEALIEKYL